MPAVVVPVALFAMVAGASFVAMRSYRAAGVQPSFYQSNFEAAVLMACGRGFGAASPAPEALRAFLDVTRDRLDCSELPASMSVTPLTSAAHASWYYLYGAAAGVWRVTGVSWRALDALVAALSGTVALALYGLMRLAAPVWLSAAIALVLAMSPSNLRALLSLRDYSKAPFVLSAILILAVLVMRPLSRTRTLILAGVYGAVVGLGYGFRGDLAIMVPFGLIVVAAFLPPLQRGTLVRNAQAIGVLLFAFALAAFPVLSGLKYGGCQFHFALLGLTTPLTSEMRLTPPLYRFGDHLLDAYVDIKVGDYAARVLHQPAPNLCSADYDTASGQLYRQLAMTFPADLAVRAYSSVLMILRVGLQVPEMMQPVPPFPDRPWIAGIYRVMSRLTSLIAPAGPLLTLAAIGVAFAAAPRLGLALAFFVLFLTGYPAIQFEERHWFHLRFIPWWSALVVASAAWWWRTHGMPRGLMIRAAGAVVGLLIVMGAALGIIRLIQERAVKSLAATYLAAATEPLATAADETGLVRVQWQPSDYGTPPGHRGADLLAVTLDRAGCAAASPAVLRVKYDADGAGHDLSGDIDVSFAAGDAPTRVFIPVFWLATETQTQLRFAGVQVPGASAGCVGAVARVTGLANLPLWLQMQLPADWEAQPLYQSMRLPRLLNR